MPQPGHDCSIGEPQSVQNLPGKVSIPHFGQENCSGAFGGAGATSIGFSAAERFSSKARFCASVGLNVAGLVLIFGNFVAVI